MAEVGKRMRESRLNVNAEMEVIENKECSKNIGTFYKF